MLWQMAENNNIFFFIKIHEKINLKKNHKPIAVFKAFGNDLSVRSRMNFQNPFSYLHSIIFPSMFFISLVYFIFEKGSLFPPTYKYPTFDSNIL